MTEQLPIRVLHSLGGLGRGGIETWLANVVRQKHPGLSMDFVLKSPPGEGGDLEDEIRSHGCRIFYRPRKGSLVRKLEAAGLVKQNNFISTLAKSANYDAFHVHGEELNGDAVMEACQAGIPVRVAHCHNTVVARGKRGLEMLVRRARYYTIDRYRTMRYATDLVGCSNDAGKLMVGHAWGVDPRCKVLYCGVPVRHMLTTDSPVSRADFLSRYSLPSDAIVVGHVGSMGETPVKNHAFLLRIFQELVRRDRRYYLVMLGGGVGRSRIEAEVNSLRLADRVRMPGILSNVQEHMAALFDVHCLPSLAEGLPVVAIEACASGLYTVMSAVITRELEQHVPGRFERMSLSRSPAEWADRLELGIRLREPSALGARRIMASPFGIEQSTEALYQLYAARRKAQAEQASHA